MRPIQRPGSGPKDSEAVTVPRLELTVQKENGAPAQRVVVQDGDIARIGSHPSNHLVLTDPLVSRFHCCAKLEQGGWRLVDTGSLNGTRVGAVRVRDADLPLPECEIDVGNSRVRIRVLEAVGSDEVPTSASFGALHGSSLVMRKLFALMERVATSESTVLVEGESGTGKELVANEIVQRGPREDKPLVVFDCSSVSPTLIESQLFGCVRGAFTGADRDRIGAFEAANGGTLFLDEIGELPLDMQPKLLRALEAREVRRLGETQARKVDVRVIAATNRMLEREVNHGRFREDLYYRLSVVTIRVPPLREHLEDLVLLVRAFLRDQNASEAEKLFTPEVLADMGRYDWPGNVRELRNYVERAVVLRTINPQSKREPSPSKSGEASFAANIEVPFTTAKDGVVADFERAYLSELLKWSGGNISKAARKAGMDRMYLHRLLQRHGLRDGGG
jgi:transcriptional regulator with GAF, ATPase, and Fis domain